jgi:hypothetical protein
MTNEQLYLLIGLPMLWNTLLWAASTVYMHRRLDDLKDLWRAELRRVEEVLDARLKHIEENR